jgi:hypothetical protein
VILIAIHRRAVKSLESVEDKRDLSVEKEREEVISKEGAQVGEVVHLIE